MAGAVVGVVTLPTLAQSPNGTPATPGGELTSEPLAAPVTAAVTAAAPVDTPTRRPTHPATATSVATPTADDTETATAAPPTLSATPPPVPTATATTIVAIVRTPPNATALLAALARRAGSAAGTASAALGAILALVAVWFGARLGGARVRGERRRARRTLATAMLLELRRIDAVLRRVVTLANPASFPSLEHPIMEAALRDLTLFHTVTAARIAQFHSALRSIQHEIGDYRDNPLRWAGRLGELNQLIKGRASTACRAVPELVKALEHEGGAPPPHLPEPPSSSADPSGLPPPPFGAHEGDDWTL